MKGYVLTIILLLILFSSSVYGEADSKVEVIEISGSVLFMKERDNTVLTLSERENLSYGDTIIILEDSFVILRDSSGKEIKLEEAKQVVLKDLFGMETGESNMSYLSYIAFLALAIIVVIAFVATYFWGKRKAFTEKSETFFEKKKPVAPTKAEISPEDIFKDDIEIRFDENDKELVFEVIKGGVIPSYSTVRLDEKKFTCLLNKLNKVNEDKFQEKE